MQCFLQLERKQNNMSGKLCEFCGSHHCFRYCSWPLAQQKSRHFIGLNRILLCSESSCQITKVWENSPLLIGYLSAYCWFHESFFKCFLLFFLFSDWLKSNHLKSRIEGGFLDIFSCHICSAVTETIGVTNYATSFGAKKCSENQGRSCWDDSWSVEPANNEGHINKVLINNDILLLSLIKDGDMIYTTHKAINGSFDGPKQFNTDNKSQVPEHFWRPRPREIPRKYIGLVCRMAIPPSEGGTIFLNIRGWGWL